MKLRHPFWLNRYFLSHIAEEITGLFDQVVFIVGDDTPSSSGFRERLAGDNFTFGSAFTAVDFGDAAGYGSARHHRLISEPHLGTDPGDADPVTIILEKSVGSRILAQVLDSTALQKNVRLT